MHCFYVDPFICIDIYIYIIHIYIYVYTVCTVLFLFVWNLVTKLLCFCQHPSDHHLLTQQFRALLGPTQGISSGSQRPINVSHPVVVSQQTRHLLTKTPRCPEPKLPPTVDGSEIRRSPVDMGNVPLFTGFYTCWVGGAGCLPSTVYVTSRSLT